MIMILFVFHFCIGIVGAEKQISREANIKRRIT